MIVVSILLALWVDAWWEGRQDAAERLELVEAMERDLQLTRTRLETSILRGDSLLARSQGFLSVADHLETVPVDSIRSLVEAAFRGNSFTPALSAYEGALATGRLDLLRSPALLASISEFQGVLSTFEENRRSRSHFYYLGPTMDLRRELGSLGAIVYDPSLPCPPRVGLSCPYPARFNVGDAELRAFAARRDVYAVVESANVLRQNAQDQLRRMDEIALRALEELGKLR